MEISKSQENRKKFIEECFDFSPSERNAFARCCGLPILKAPIDVLISFWGMKSNRFMTDVPLWSEEIESKFFIACLISKYGKNNANQSNKVLVPNELRKMYDLKNSCTRNIQIETMLKTPLDNTAQLCYRLNSLIELMPKNVQENLDFEKLYTDIRYWNQPVSGTSFKRNGSRYVWAYQIVRNVGNENIDENDE